MPLARGGLSKEGMQGVGATLEQGYLRRAKPRDEERVAKAERLSRVAGNARPLTWSGRHCEARSKGMRDRAACPRTTSNARNLESRVKNIPAKDVLPLEHESMASRPHERARDLRVEVARKR